MNLLILFKVKILIFRGDFQGSFMIYPTHLTLQWIQSSVEAMQEWTHFSGLHKSLVNQSNSSFSMYFLWKVNIFGKV